MHKRNHRVDGEIFVGIGRLGVDLPIDDVYDLDSEGTRTRPEPGNETMLTPKIANVYVRKSSRGGYVAATHVLQLQSARTRKSVRKAMSDANAIQNRLIKMGYNVTIVSQV